MGGALDWGKGRLPLDFIQTSLKYLTPKERVVAFDQALVLTVEARGLSWYFPARFIPHKPAAVTTIGRAHRFVDVALAADYGEFWKRYLPSEIAPNIEIKLVERDIPKPIQRRQR